MGPEEIAQIVLSTMQAMKALEEEKEKKSVRASQITKCLRAVVDHEGEFDGKNVTKYPKVYWREVKLHDLDEETAVLKLRSWIGSMNVTKVWVRKSC